MVPLDSSAISFLGILMGIILFVILAFRGVNLLLSSLGCTCLMWIFSGMPVLDGIWAVFLPGMGYFLEHYLLLFLFSALLGRLMCDGGTAKRLALAISRVIKKTGSARGQRFLCMLLVPCLYFVLCYIGISGFVVIFTVMPIARELFQATDTPWRLYCCGGAWSISQGFLVGSLTVANVYAAEVCGTPTTAGLFVSLMMVGVYTVVSLLLFWLTLRQIEHIGEGFLPSGRGIAAADLEQGISEDRLPSLWTSLLPMAVVVILSAAFGLRIEGVLLIGCLLTTAVGWKNIRPRLIGSLSAGVSASYAPVLNVAATYAIGVSLKVLPGFAEIEKLLSQLPPMLEATGLGVLATFIMASTQAPIIAFGSTMLEKYLQAGLSGAQAHRMMTLIGFASISPHNAGIINAAQVLRLPYSDCIKTYLVFTYVPGFATLILTLVVFQWL